MRQLTVVCLAVLFAVPVAGCASGPSDDQIVEHAKTIVLCNLRQEGEMIDKSIAAEKEALANPNAPLPTPMPSADPHKLRLCYVAMVETQTPDIPDQYRAGTLTAGRACERFINTDDDQAMGDYLGCIAEGEKPMMIKIHVPTPKP
jgi:hypothetical protein